MINLLKNLKLNSSFREIATSSETTIVRPSDSLKKARTSRSSKAVPSGTEANTQMPGFNTGFIPFSKMSKSFTGDFSILNYQISYFCVFNSNRFKKINVVCTDPNTTNKTSFVEREKIKMKLFSLQFV